MVRMTDLPATSQANLKALDCPRFENVPLVARRPLSEHKVALISSAGLFLRGEPLVRRSAADYRKIPHATPARNVFMSHVSVNFDRTGFQQDLNVVLPRERLQELAANNVIGAAADTHYSFMGATDPRNMEQHAQELGERLAGKGVTAAVLLPV